MFIALPALGVIHGLWFEPIRKAQAFSLAVRHECRLLASSQGSPFSEHHLELRHFWSLVEERFYFFWPAIVYAMNTTSLKRVCISLIASAFTFRLLGVYLDDQPDFLLLLSADGMPSRFAVSVHEDAFSVKRFASQLAQ